MAESTSGAPSPEWSTLGRARGINLILSGTWADSRVRISGDERGALLIATAGGAECWVRLSVQEVSRLHSFLNALYPGTRPIQG